MTALSSLASLPEKGFKAFVKGNPLTAFIGLSFSITWLLAALALILAQKGLGVIPITLPSDWFILLGTAMGMAGSAFYVTYALGSRDGVAKLISHYHKWRIKSRRQIVPRK